jgi:membrane protein required for colicin V production
MSFSPLDAVLTLVLLVFVGRGVARGFVAEAFALAAVALGVLVAALLGGRLAPQVERLFGASVWSGPVASLALFAVVYLAVALVGSGLREGVENLSLEQLDRALGFILGVFEGVLVVTGAVVILKVQPLFDSKGLLDGSFYARTLLPLLGATAESFGWKIGV